MIEVCKNILDLTNIDSKIDDMDTIKTILMQLKRRADASFQCRYAKVINYLIYIFRYALMQNTTILSSSHLNRWVKYSYIAKGIICVNFFQFVFNRYVYLVIISKIFWIT